MLLGQALCWSVIGFGTAITFMGYVSFDEGTEVFWSVFSINYVLGLMQGWFLIDILKMAMNFYGVWKEVCSLDYVLFLSVSHSF